MCDRVQRSLADITVGLGEWANGLGEQLRELEWLQQRLQLLESTKQATRAKLASQVQRLGRTLEDMRLRAREMGVEVIPLCALFY